METDKGEKEEQPQAGQMMKRRRSRRMKSGDEQWREGIVERERRKSWGGLGEKKVKSGNERAGKSVGRCREKREQW